MTYVKLEDVLAIVEKNAEGMSWSESPRESGAGFELLKRAKALRSLPTDDGWEDIATAPRDGTEIILFDPSFRRFRIGSWREDDFMSDEGEMWLDDSYDDFSTGFCSCPLSPTHWRPLPAPPAC